jgi:phosphoribosyl isomerase A
MDLSGGVSDDASPDVAVVLGVHGATLAAPGWTRDGGRGRHSPASTPMGAPAYVVTNVDKDGTLTGRNLGLPRGVCASGL